ARTERGSLTARAGPIASRWRSRAPRAGRPSSALASARGGAALPGAAQKVLDLSHQLLRVELLAGDRLRLLGGRRVVLLLEGPDGLPRVAVPGHGPITLRREFRDRPVA